MIEKHYRIRMEEAEDPTGGINTNAVRSCIACGGIISGRGGGGEYICATCYHTLYSRTLHKHFRSIKVAEETGNE